MVSPSEEASDLLRSEHAWCLELKSSHAFAWFVDQVQRRYNVALRNITTPDGASTRDFEAGRLDALGDVMAIVDRHYRQVAQMIEVVD